MGSGNPIEREPPVYKWYVVYCVAMAVLYLLFVVGGFFLLHSSPLLKEAEQLSAKLAGLFGIVSGACLLAVFSIAPMLPRKKWVWTYGVVLICIGLTSCMCLPVCIPLLIHWMKPEAKAYFDKAPEGPCRAPEEPRAEESISAPEKPTGWLGFESATFKNWNVPICLREALKIYYSKNTWKILIASAAYVIASIQLKFVASGHTSVLGYAHWIQWVILYPLFSGTIICLIAEQYIEPQPAIRNAFRFALRKYFTLVGATLLRVCVTTLLGASIIGLPFAIYLVVGWIFVYEAVLLEGLTARQALFRSHWLVGQNWWRTFSLVVVVFVPTIAIEVAIWKLLGVAQPEFGFTYLAATFTRILLLPFADAAILLFYFHLRAKKGESAREPTAELRREKSFLRIYDPRPWYYENVAIVFFTVLLFPVGLILLGRSPHHSKRSKIAVTMCAITLFSLFLFGRHILSTLPANVAIPSAKQIVLMKDMYFKALHEARDRKAGVPKDTKPRILKMGSPFWLSGLTYTIDKIEMSKNVEMGSLSYRADGDGVLLYVYCTIRNDSSSLQNRLDDFFDIVDYKGRRFGERLFIQFLTKETSLSAPKPGSVTKTRHLFKIPRDSYGNKGLKLVFPERIAQEGIVVELN